MECREAERNGTADHQPEWNAVLNKGVGAERIETPKGVG